MIDKNIQRNINGLHVYCINNKEGCKWKGELKELSSHLQQGKREGDCQYVRIRCKHQCCIFVDQRYKVTTHERKDCPDRPYTCEYCGDQDSFSYITEIHYSSCRPYPMSCPNDCKREKFLVIN